MKERKVRFSFSGKEKKILLEGVLLFRNRALREGKPTEELDTLLQKLLQG